MALPFSLPNYIELGKISQFLAANDQNNVAKNQGGTIYPDLSRLIYITRTSIEWQYSINPTAASLYDTGVYLKALIGGYATEAANIIGGAGGIFINPPSGSQVGIVGVDVSYTVPNVIAQGNTVITLSYDNPVFNTLVITLDQVEMPPNNVNVASYSATYSSTGITVTFTIPAITGQLYRFMFLRYTLQ